MHCSKLKISKIYTFLLIVMPILDQYLFFSLTFLEIAILLSTVLYLCGYSKSLQITHNWIPYFCFVILVICFSFLYINSLELSVLVLRMIKLGLLLFNIFCIAPKLFDFEYGFKVYTFIVIIVSLILVFQNILFIINGNGTMLLLPGTTLNYNNGIESSAFMSQTLDRITTGYYYRPCSIFIEPSYQVQYSIPWLAIALSFSGNKKIKIRNWKLILVSIALVLTTSFLGIVCVAILWGVEIIRLLRSKSIQVKKRLLWLLPALCFVAFFLLSQSSVLATITSKLSSMSNSTMSSSFSLRMLRGWECFKQTSPFIKLFGCGYGNLSAYYSQIGLTTIYDGNITDLSYMNGFFTLLCSMGGIGTFLYFYILAPFIKSRNRTVRMIFVSWVLLMISSACFDSGMYFLIIAFMLSVNNNLHMNPMKRKVCMYA